MSRERMHVIRDGKIDYALIESIVKDICGSKYAYKIEYSNTTESVYIRLYTIDMQYRVTMRISQHLKDKQDIGRYVLKTMLVHTSTRMKTVESFIGNGIKILELRRVHREMDKHFSNLSN